MSLKIIFISWFSHSDLYNSHFYIIIEFIITIVSLTYHIIHSWIVIGPSIIYSLMYVWVNNLGMKKLVLKILHYNIYLLIIFKYGIIGWKFLRVKCDEKKILCMVRFTHKPMTICVWQWMKRKAVRKRQKTLIISF